MREHIEAIKTAAATPANGTFVPEAGFWVR